MPLLAIASDPARFSTILALLAITWYVTSAVYSWYRLRHVPGPFLASFSYLWLARLAYGGKQLEGYDLATRKYGSLVRVGPSDLLTDDPEVIKRLSSAKSQYWKSKWYTGFRFNPHHLVMFIMRDPATHDQIKAQLMPGYSGRDISSVEPAVDSRIEAFITLIRRKYITSPGVGGFRPLDLARVIPLFTLDVISKLALGKEFGCLETDSDRYQFYEAMEGSLPWISLTTDVPWMRDIVYSTLGLRLFGAQETDSKGLGRSMKLANEEVRRRFAPGADKEEKSMLGSFIRHGLTQTECEVETLFMFVAGSDTTAAAIKITVLYILAVPRVYQRLKDEIAAAVHEGRVSKKITNAEAKELPYLQAVVNEGLRIRPITTNMLSKEVPKGGDTIDGKFIPAGTAIGVNISSMLRSKAVFGEDADMFRPERFLEVDATTRSELQRHVELTFGYGRWMCAGKSIALMEMNKIFFELLRHFDFQLVNPQEPMVSRSHALFVESGLLVRITESEAPTTII
ncbi:cytochrome P450 [Hypoxylon rubiginosum]|uniref:Cytochrome P450 n=1 Tax=Hypoxylon rubiginosum TaxID=110542 RepID=A0ACB9Z4I5_9PEZI|nr:cytochrome P450 [Hypoxylon rubiginosum]